MPRPTKARRRNDSLTEIRQTIKDIQPVLQKLERLCTEAPDWNSSPTGNELNDTPHRLVLDYAERIEVADKAETPRLLRAREVCQLLNVSRRTLYRSPVPPFVSPLLPSGGTLSAKSGVVHVVRDEKTT